MLIVGVVGLDSNIRAFFVRSKIPQKFKLSIIKISDFRDFEFSIFRDFEILSFQDFEFSKF
jgi:hypothetical protein